jgi:hypothetical protein
MGAAAPGRFNHRAPLINLNSRNLVSADDVPKQSTFAGTGLGYLCAAPVCEVRRLLPSRLRLVHGARRPGRRLIRGS